MEGEGPNDTNLRRKGGGWATGLKILRAGMEPTSIKALKGGVIKRGIGQEKKGHALKIHVQKSARKTKNAVRLLA